MKTTRIQFMTPLVRAIRADAKTVTRRPMRTQPPADTDDVVCVLLDVNGASGYYAALRRDSTVSARFDCLYGAPGDVLAVCEELRRGADGEITYSADGAPVLLGGEPTGWEWKRRVQTARYCPAWAVRTRLPLVSVRPERLSAVTDDEAQREGIGWLGLAANAVEFAGAWDAMYAGGPFASERDPWVWRLEWEPVR